MKVAKGKVLISEPFLPDPNFSRAVVLLTEYSEEGTVGYVLNQATDIEVGKVVDELESLEAPLYQGGPVDLESFHYLHQYPEIAGSAEIMEGVYWGGDFDQIVLGIETGIYEVDRFRFLVGYSGWSAGQLEDELEEKTWIVSELKPEIIFNTKIEDKELWKHAIGNVDGDDSLLANSPFNPYLN